MPAGSGRYPSGQRGQTVNLLAYAFGGSNPPLPTIAAMGACANRAAGGLLEMGVAPTHLIDAGGRAVASDRVDRQAGHSVGGAGFAFCGNSSAVERQPSKLGVAGSNPVSRSIVSMGASTDRSVGGLFARALSTDRSAGGLFEEGVAPIGPVDRRGSAAVVARSAGGARDVVTASTDSNRSAHVAQLAEHALGKGEVSGSIPDMGSRFFSPTKRGAHGR